MSVHPISPCCIAVVPVVPVLISLVTDLSTGDDPTNDIIVRRSGGQSL